MFPFFRLPTTKDADLRTALLLEQTAHSFLRVRPPMIRKFSFHLVLAGYRFSRCGQVWISLHRFFLWFMKNNTHYCACTEEACIQVL